MTTLLVVDIETTGMVPPAAVIELGWCSLSLSTPDGDRMFGELRGSELFGLGGQVMTSDNRAVHHIDPEHLRDAPLFSRDEWAHFHDADYVVAHNSEFEASFLGPEFGAPWICTYKVALRLVPDALSHSNSALKYELGIPDHPSHHPPHRAEPDAVVTAELLDRLIAIAHERSPLLPLDEILLRMAQITQEPRLLSRCPIGKDWKGRPWAEVNAGFLNWMLRQPDMEPDYRWNVERELTRRRRGD